MKCIALHWVEKYFTLPRLLRYKPSEVPINLTVTFIIERSGAQKLVPFLLLTFSHRTLKKLTFKYK